MKKLVNGRTREVNVSINGVEMIIPIGGYVVVNSSARLEFAAGDIIIREVEQVLRSESEYSESSLLNG